MTDTEGVDVRQRPGELIDVQLHQDDRQRLLALVELPRNAVDRLRHELKHQVEVQLVGLRRVHFKEYISRDPFQGIHFKGYIRRETFQGIHFKGYISRDTFQGIHSKGYIPRDTFQGIHSKGSIPGKGKGEGGGNNNKDFTLENVHSTGLYYRYCG